jgi:TonB family protein
MISENLATYMRFLLAVLIFAAALSCAYSQTAKSNALPITEFELGRHTFFDFGPPTDFYELFVVRPDPSGTAIERITVTPPVDVCFQPAKVETVFAKLSDSVDQLLGSDPCVIPDKELKRELKRCKKCLVFSGANVAMRLQCASGPRIIRADILDRDMFGSAPNTPKHTSWTMGLLEKLDSATGPGAMEKPAFASLSEPPTQTPVRESAAISELESGKYDLLFAAAPEKISDLYKASKKPKAVPNAVLVSSRPFQPDALIAPEYPPIAKLAHIEGSVEFTIKIGDEGRPEDFTVVRGHPMLLGALKDAVSKWTFPKNDSGQTISAVVRFNLNCPAESDKAK